MNKFVRHINDDLIWYNTTDIQSIMPRRNKNQVLLWFDKDLDEYIDQTALNEAEIEDLQCSMRIHFPLDKWMDEWFPTVERMQHRMAYLIQCSEGKL